MELKILTDRFNYFEAVEEEKNFWISETLSYIGIEYSPDIEIDIPNMVDFLFLNKVEIVDYPSIGAVKISHNGETIGEWGGPELTLKKDQESGALYYEITIETWSIMDEEISLE